MTAQQIAWAAQNGFDTIRAPAEDLVQPALAESARRTLFDAALASLSAGKSVLIYSAAGPDDPGIRATREHIADGSSTARLLGAAMGTGKVDEWWQLGLLFTLPAIGATVGYEFSLDERPDATTTAEGAQALRLTPTPLMYQVRF